MPVEVFVLGVLLVALGIVSLFIVNMCFMMVCDKEHRLTISH